MTLDHPPRPLLALGKLTLAAAEATEAFGAALGVSVHPGLHIQLHGDLGAGKTTVVRALLRALGYNGPVKSPTYALVETYVLPLPEGMKDTQRIEFEKFLKIYCYHFDFYRFNRSEDWQDAGFREYFGQGSICLVEWPEQAGALLPAPDLGVWLDYIDSDAEAGRELEVQAFSEPGVQCLKRMALLMQHPLKPAA
jgi:tRNA threonylcarbamoyladenosine biosynthesis protein TsaE